MEFTQNQLELAIVEHQNLQNPPELNQALLNQLDSHIKGAHWIDSHQCITMIRSIIKFYPQYTGDVMGKYGTIILQLFSNGKTQTLKNIFKLLKQIFMLGQTVNVEAVVSLFMPVLIKKAANQLGHIKQMSQEVLTVISTNCGYNRTFEITTELSCDKNNQVAELSIKLLAVLLQNIGQGLTQLNPSSLQMLTRGMNLLVCGKRNNMKTSSLDICMFLYNQLGCQNFLQLLNFSLNQNEVSALGQAMQTHRTQKSKVTPLADVLKQRKNQMSESNPNVNCITMNNQYNNNWQTQQNQQNYR